jgi:hypothetical protein
MLRRGQAMVALLAALAAPALAEQEPAISVPLRLERGVQRAILDHPAVHGQLEITVEDRGGLPSSQRPPKPEKEEPTPTNPRFQLPAATPEHEYLVGFRHLKLKAEQQPRPNLPPWLQQRGEIRAAPPEDEYRYPSINLPAERCLIVETPAGLLVLLVTAERQVVAAFRLAAGDQRFRPTELSDEEIQRLASLEVRTYATDSTDR